MTQKYIKLFVIRVINKLQSTRVILKYAGTMAPMAPISLVVGGAKAEL